MTSWDWEESPSAPQGPAQPMPAQRQRPPPQVPCSNHRFPDCRDDASIASLHSLPGDAAVAADDASSSHCQSPPLPRLCERSATTAAALLPRDAQLKYTSSDLPPSTPACLSSSFGPRHGGRLRHSSGVFGAALRRERQRRLSGVPNQLRLPRLLRFAHLAAPQPRHVPLPLPLSTHLPLLPRDGLHRGRALPQLPLPPLQEAVPHHAHVPPLSSLVCSRRRPPPPTPPPARLFLPRHPARRFPFQVPRARAAAAPSPPARRHRHPSLQRPHTPPLPGRRLRRQCLALAYQPL